MKRAWMFIFVMLLIPSALALQITSEDVYDSGETVLVKVSGNFIKPILEQNTVLLRGHTRTSAEITIANIEDEYYISTYLIDKSEGNHSIKIENAEYKDGTKVIAEDILISFMISNQTADFGVNPGFITTNGNFTLEIQNLNPSTITLEIDGDNGTIFSPEGSSFNIKSGDIEKIDFVAKQVDEDTLRSLVLTANDQQYSLPVYVMTTEAIEKEKERSYEFSPSTLDFQMLTNDNTTKIVYLENTGEETLENITIRASNEIIDYVSFSVERIEELEENTSIKIEIYFSADYEEQKLIGQITAEAEPALYTYVAVEMESLADFIPTGEVDNQTGSPQPGDTDLIDDAKKESSAAKVIGWIIIIILVIAIAGFYFLKYRRGPKKVKMSMLEIAKKRSKNPQVEESKKNLP